MLNVSNFYARTIARELQLADDQWPSYTCGTGQSRSSILNDNQMPLSDFNRLLSNALRVSEDPGLGLRFGRHSNLLALGESGFAAIAAPNLIHALQALGDFSRLQADYMNLDVQVGLQHLSFRGEEHEPMGVTRRSQHEVFVLTIQNTLELILGRPFTEGQYYFAYPEPEYVSRYGGAFHSCCHFEAEQTGVDVPRGLSESPSPYYDKALWEQGRNRCIAMMQAYNDQRRQLHSHHILTLLRSQMPPLPSFSHTAKAMNLSERTLMRRLKEEGHSYRQLQSTVLAEWAHHYLTETALSVDAIGLQLGYQDSANFRRAFKRWQGCSASEYRQKHVSLNPKH